MFEQKRITDIAPEQLQALLKSVVGMTREHALDTITKAGFRARILSVDGSPIPAQYKFEDTRINVDMIHGIVTKSYPG